MSLPVVRSVHVLSVSGYSPWVGNNNNAAVGGIAGPDGENYNRSVTIREAGGANIVVGTL